LNGRNNNNDQQKNKCISLCIANVGTDRSEDMQGCIADRVKHIMYEVSDQINAYESQTLSETNLDKKIYEICEKVLNKSQNINDEISSFLGTYQGYKIDNESGKFLDYYVVIDRLKAIGEYGGLLVKDKGSQFSDEDFKNFTCFYNNSGTLQIVKAEDGSDEEYKKSNRPENKNEQNQGLSSNKNPENEDKPHVPGKKGSTEKEYKCLWIGLFIGIVLCGFPLGWYIPTLIPANVLPIGWQVSLCISVPLLIGFIVDVLISKSNDELSLKEKANTNTTAKNMFPKDSMPVYTPANNQPLDQAPKPTP
jgi:hypothetical protein